MKFKSQEVEIDIPPKVVVEIMQELEGILGDTVIIGGRAVNIWCYHNKRPTRDIDVALGTDPSKVNDAVKKLNNAGFFVNLNGDGKIVSVEYMGWKDGVKVDLYYSRPISGVEIDDIIRTAEERPLTKRETVKVVNPALLIIMKLEAGREKDKKDIANIISSLYGSVDKLMAEENEIISRYFKDPKSKEWLAGMINSVVKEVDFSSNFRN